MFCLISFFFFFLMTNYWTTSHGRDCEELLDVITVQLLQPYYRCPRVPTFALLFFFPPPRRLIFVQSELMFFFPCRRVPLSLRNKNHIGPEWKKKGFWGNVASISSFSPLPSLVIDIWGLILCPGLLFSKWAFWALRKQLRRWKWNWLCVGAWESGIILA